MRRRRRRTRRPAWDVAETLRWWLLMAGLLAIAAAASWYSLDPQ